jgi:hypothetical protein
MTVIRYIRVAVKWVLENAKLRGYVEIKDVLRIHLTVNSVEETICDETSIVIRWLLVTRNVSSQQPEGSIGRYVNPIGVVFPKQWVASSTGRATGF